MSYLEPKLLSRMNKNKYNLLLVPAQRVDLLQQPHQ